MTWNQPCCERCWVTVMNPGGSPIRDPIRLRDVVDLETCAWCGFPTWAGIYVRADPDTVPFPHPGN